jgi:hypothetical protein
MTAISTPQTVYQYEMRLHDGQNGWDDKNKSTTVLTKELDEEKHDHPDSSIHWQTGVWARFPWLGFGALITILISIAMTIVIMKTSHGKNPNQWPGMSKCLLLRYPLTDLFFF